MAQTNEKPICEVSEYYGDNVFMLVSKVNKALRRFENLPVKKILALTGKQRDNILVT